MNILKFEKVHFGNPSPITHLGAPTERGEAPGNPAAYCRVRLARNFARAWRFFEGKIFFWMFYKKLGE